MEVSEWIALASAIAFIVTAAAACLSYAKVSLRWNNGGGCRPTT